MSSSDNSDTAAGLEPDAVRVSRLESTVNPAPPPDFAPPPPPHNTCVQLSISVKILLAFACTVALLSLVINFSCRATSLHASSTPGSQSGLTQFAPAKTFASWELDKGYTRGVLQDWSHTFTFQIQWVNINAPAALALITDTKSRLRLYRLENTGQIHNEVRLQSKIVQPGLCRTWSQGFACINGMLGADGVLTSWEEVLQLEKRKTGEDLHYYTHSTSDVYLSAVEGNKYRVLRVSPQFEILSSALISVMPSPDQVQAYENQILQPHRYGAEVRDLDLITLDQLKNGDLSTAVGHQKIITTPARAQAGLLQDGLYVDVSGQNSRQGSEFIFYNNFGLQVARENTELPASLVLNSFSPPTIVQVQVALTRPITQDFCGDVLELVFTPGGSASFLQYRLQEHMSATLGEPCADNKLWHRGRASLALADGKITEIITPQNLVGSLMNVENGKIFWRAQSNVYSYWYYGKIYSWSDNTLTAWRPARI